MENKWFNLGLEDAPLPEEGTTVEVFAIGKDGKGYLCEGKRERVKTFFGYKNKWNVSGCPVKVTEVFAWRFKEDAEAEGLKHDRAETE